jgi:urease accessory protein
MMAPAESGTLRHPAPWRQAAAPATSGVARLEAEVVGEATTVTSVYATQPLRLLVPVPRGPSFLAYLASFGGGCVAGDQTRLDLRLGQGTRGFVGTQSSSKVYRNPDSRPTGHRTSARLASGAVLVFTPDPVQAFADAVYVQHQEFHLETGAGLVLWDCLSAGRVAAGERWAFTRLASRNEIHVNGRVRFLDRQRLDPGDGPLEGPYRMGRFNAQAMAVVIGEPLRAMSERLLHEMAEEPVPRRRVPLITTVSPLADGVLLRVVGEQLESVMGELRKRLAFVPQLLGEDPWSRKG